MQLKMRRHAMVAPPAIVVVGSVVLIAAAVTAGVGVAGVPTAEINRFTIDGGGDMRSTGGGLELSATIGQPEAGVSAGGPYQLSAGFWFPLPAGDAGEDGLVSLADYAEFRACATGPDGGVAPDGCQVFDVDHSSTIDLADFARIQQAYTGP
jgi:hypothetical protein